MEHTKKMALVEPRLLASLQQQKYHNHQPNILEQELCRLDQAMQDVLDRKDVPQEEKLNLYQQILQKYLLYKDKAEPLEVKVVGTPSAPQEPMPAAATMPVMTPVKDDPKTSIESQIIQSAPKNLRQKASALLRRIKQDDNIEWNTKGELVYKGEVVPKSHIHDLVQDVLRKRKNHVPKGWETFAKALKESNIPQDLVGNQDRWQWMDQQDQSIPIDTTQSASDVYNPKIKSRSSKQLCWTPYK